jgi:hypothetical protein
LGIDLSYASNIVTNLRTNSQGNVHVVDHIDADETQSTDQTSNENLEFVKANYSICKTPPLAVNDDTETQTDNNNVKIVSADGSSILNSSRFDEDTINGSYEENTNLDEKLVTRVNNENGVSNQAAESSDEMTEKADKSLEKLILVSKISEHGFAYGNLK